MLLFWQVYEYGTVIKDAVDIHYPVDEMVCNSKIRSVCYILNIKLCTVEPHLSGLLRSQVDHSYNRISG